MTDRLFDIDDVPEVPLLPEPRRSRGDHDARFRNDYPPNWHKCLRCLGRGVCFGDSNGFPLSATGDTLNDDMREHALARTMPQVLADRGYQWVECPDCLGMGSLKGRVRREAAHRCVRCAHPFMTRSDARMLGVEPTPGRWSPCDDLCTHRGPIRWLPVHRLVASDVWQIDTESPAGVHFDQGRHAVQAEWRVLTVHHLDGDKANVRWWNLAALCQRCHLEIQSKVVMERIYPHEHSEWFRPFVAGYYAWVYLGENLSRAEVAARLDELLALERAA